MQYLLQALGLIVSLAAAVFFPVLAVVSSHVSGGSLPVGLSLLATFLPVFLGAALGYVSGLVLRKVKTYKAAAWGAVLALAATGAVGILVESFLPEGLSFNFLLLGMASSAVMANMVDETRLNYVLQHTNPVIMLCLMTMILSLGADLDWRLIASAGFTTFLYIIFRGIGKWSGAYVGVKATHGSDKLAKCLGFTLLPHSGVSLVFTSLSVAAIGSADPAGAALLQGTIAAAAVINEIIAVMLARKGFQWAGEIGKAS